MKRQPCQRCGKGTALRSHKCPHNVECTEDRRCSECRIVDLVLPMIEAEKLHCSDPLDIDKAMAFYRALGGLQQVAEQAIKQRSWRGGRIR